MEPQAILSADPLDILFENRNKLYGAYPLRKYYAQRLYLSLFFIFSLIGITIIIYLHFYTVPVLKKMMEIKDVYIGSIVPLPPEKPTSPALRKTSRKLVNTVVDTPPLIVANTLEVKPIASVEEMKDADIGLKSIAGDPGDGQPHDNATQGQGTVITMTDPVEVKPEILKRAEVMPEFPGGMEALKRFLLKNLRMPDNLTEEGTQVKVVARFVVGIDGKVSDIEITKEADAPFNNEVRRVIRKMPDWIPGSQNHHPVAVYFSLPVNFISSD
jgi:periplasmic protein TonB